MKDIQFFSKDYFVGAKDVSDSNVLKNTGIIRKIVHLFLESLEVSVRELVRRKTWLSEYPAFLYQLVLHPYSRSA